MLALYRSGRQAEALDAYRSAHHALVEELGVEPGRELKELHAAILEQDPALDPQPSAARVRRPADAEGRAIGTSSDSFVGREHELSEFRATFDDALAGRSSLFLIAGEPGIGKSRLADELTSTAEGRGARVCWGRCWEAGGAPAYWPWVEALRAYIRDGDESRVREQLAPAAADLAQMLPELHRLFPDLPPVPSLDPEGARFRLFDSTASFLRAAGAAQPLVLVLDDLHAADKPSLLLLQFLAGSLRGARITIVAAYRDTETRTNHALRETVAEVRREPITRAIRLGGLDLSEVAHIIELIVGTEPSDDLAAAIHRETEGNPLFVGELVRLLAAEGRLEDAASSSEALSIPQGVRDVIGHRLRHLSGECKRVLSVASVLGREFSLDALALVSGRAERALHDPLDEARAARVVGDVSGGRSRVRFSHALIRDSLYGDLGTKERLRLHGSAAAALEQLYADEPEPHLAELAHHFVATAPGGDVDKAIDYATRAGDHASGSLAYEEAARLYEMALEASELATPINEHMRCELLLSLGDAQARGGNIPAAKDTFAEAAELARRLDEPEQMARAALGYGGRFVWFRAGGDRRLIPLLEDALRGLPEPGPLRARLLARLAGALRDHPDADRRAALSREAVEIARGLEDPATLAYALEGTYSAICWPRDSEAWLAMGIEMSQLANETGDKEHDFFGHLNAFGALMVRGEVEAADAERDAMAGLAGELRQPAQRWVVSICAGTVALLRGRLAEAERALELANAVGSRAQGLDATFYYVMNLQTWALRREQGRLAEVQHALTTFVRDYPNFMDYPNFIFRSVLISVDNDLGRVDEARAGVDRLLETYPALEVGTEWFFGTSLLAEVCASLAAGDHAEYLYEALEPYADCIVFAHPEAAWGCASRQLGLLAATMSRWDDAARHFERALEVNAEIESRPWVAHSQHDYGRALIRRGGSDHLRLGSELLRAACDGYQELGMGSWQDRAAAELAALI